MHTSHRFIAAGLLGTILFLHSVFAEDKAPVVSNDKAAAELMAKFESRSADIVKALALSDTAKAASVQKILVDHYRDINVWHDEHDAKLKELRKQNNDAVKAEAAAIKDTLKPIHDGFLAKLAEQLTTEQIETVKDNLTYNKVKVTFNAYLQMVPTLTEEQKAKILAWLKEAREEAIDGGSADEKSDIFNKYKGRINNYLSKAGIDVGKATKDWSERRKASGGKD